MCCVVAAVSIASRQMICLASAQIEENGKTGISTKVKWKTHVMFGRTRILYLAFSMSIFVYYFEFPCPKISSSNLLFIFHIICLTHYIVLYKLHNYFLKTLVSTVYKH